MGGTISNKTNVKIGYKAPEILKDITPPDLVDDALQFQVLKNVLVEIPPIPVMLNPIELVMNGDGFFIPRGNLDSVFSHSFSGLSFTNIENEVDEDQVGIEWVDCSLFLFVSCFVALSGQERVGGVVFRCYFSISLSFALSAFLTSRWWRVASLWRSKGCQTTYA
jgi:hypothetical protein